MDKFIEELIDENWSFEKQIRENKLFVEAYCDKYSTTLKGISETHENLKRELIYFFGDGRGGYTIEGIRASLKESR